jgi:molybdopterin-biosynthesis enzyme MoeA-like protein
VLFTPGLWVPLVNLRGVYVLPGIPRLFQAMLEAHMERFRGPACSTTALFTDVGEGDLAGGC